VVLAGGGFGTVMLVTDFQGVILRLVFGFMMGVFFWWSQHPVCPRQRSRSTNRITNEVAIQSRVRRMKRGCNAQGSV
jgi:hypothetical protein